MYLQSYKNFAVSIRVPLHDDPAEIRTLMDQSRHMEALRCRPAAYATSFAGANIFTGMHLIFRRVIEWLRYIHETL